MSTSACVRPTWASTQSAANVSGTDAEAMSGALASVGFDGGGATSDLLGAVCIGDALAACARYSPVCLRAPLMRARSAWGTLTGEQSDERPRSARRVSRSRRTAGQAQALAHGGRASLPIEETLSRSP